MDKHVGVANNLCQVAEEARPSSHYVLGGQRADLVAVGKLDRKRRAADTDAVPQLGRANYQNRLVNKGGEINRPDQGTAIA
ncbi:MAG TPA: hypothetical protein VGF07_09960 [Stellaceae bacterium]|jgi:hypothetical protein